MTTKFSACILFGVLTLSAQAAVTVKDKAETPAKAKAPVLHIDATPVSDGKPAGLVTSYADAIEPAQKAVVSVYSTKIVRERAPADPFLRQFFGEQGGGRESKREGVGSGVIVSPDGYILTNNHVIEGADELKVLLPDERELKAKLIGTDPKTDIAVIKIEADNLPAVTLADSDKLRIGDVVFAMGNPLDVGQTVTMGIVSAKGRSVGLLDSVQGYESFIQTDAAINMGNSGGALIDAKGRLVGINSAIISPSRGNIGIGFAIPINLASSIMHSLVENGTVPRGFLGISTDVLTAEVAESLGLKKDTKGVVITDVTKDGPADKAGLARNDVILSIGENQVSNWENLRLLIAQTIPGTVIKLKIVRDGKEKVIEATLGKLTEKPNELITGVEVTALTDELRRKLGVDGRITGVIVSDVDDESAYSDQISIGTVVVEINRSPIADVESAKALIKPGRNLLLIYYRGIFRYIGVTVPAK